MKSTFDGKIYAAEYNPCYHESSYGIVTLHWSYEGATAAIEKHKLAALQDWKDMGHDSVPEYELWRVHVYEVLP